MTPIDEHSHSRCADTVRVPRLLRLWPLAAVCLLAGPVMLWKLGQGSLSDWDEAIYAQVAKEIIQGGSWVTLHWGYEPWFEKPPLFVWSTAVLFKLFEINEFWARAASAFSGIGLVVTTYLIGRHAFNRNVGLLASVVLLTTFPFVHGARFGTTDIMLSLSLFLAIYAYMRLDGGSTKWWYLIWVSCAMGVAGLIAPMVIAMSFLIDGKPLRMLASRASIGGLLLALVIVVPWHVAMYLQHGQDFLSKYLGYHIVARATQAIETHVGGPLFYVQVLHDLFFPWFYLVPFALALTIQDNIRHKARSRVLLVAFLLVFGLYTWVRTKLGWYILPLYPVLAIVIACTVHQAYQSHRSIAYAGVLLGGVMVALSVSPKVLLVSLGLGLFAILAYVAYTRKLGHQPVVLLICGLFVLGGISKVEDLFHKKETPVARLARLADSADLGHREPLIIADFSASGRLARPSPLFYANRPIQLVYEYEALGEITSDGRERTMIIESTNIEALLDDYEVLVLADAGPFSYASIRSRASRGVD
jgi:4-amino-4-deoxy-L-arabinose transferase-like glycosyltransferase